ncbi:MAG: T9SS type A sorting domain-containing protein [Bacteroidetes bacterium]|nr:T9SS type A sorting domain-containing protein [Bacteroidota bacterium]
MKVNSTTSIQIDGTLKCGTHVVTLGSSSVFTLSSGATLYSGYPTGINGNFNTSGTKTFATDANYVYNGTTPQVTGALLPATVNNLTINNAAGVTLSQNTTVNGVITLSNGVFNNSTNSITLGPSASVVVTGGSSTVALPVELTSFTAAVRGKNVELVWNTATEVNNAGFNIERRSLTGEWTKVGFVEGNGTVNNPKSYRFSDNVPSAASYQYRLKQIDRDGKFEYSPVVDAVVGLTTADYQLSQNYPNPFNPSTTFSFAVKSAERTTVKVYNLVGQEVAVLFNDIAQPNQLYTLRFDAKTLPSGIYLYSLRSANRNEVKKMSLIK